MKFTPAPHAAFIVSNVLPLTLAKHILLHAAISGRRYSEATMSRNSNNRDDDIMTAKEWIGDAFTAGDAGRSISISSRTWRKAELLTTNKTGEHVSAPTGSRPLKYRENRDS